MSQFTAEFSADAWDLRKDAHGVAAVYIDPDSTVADINATVIIHEQPQQALTTENGREQTMRMATIHCHPDDIPLPTLRGRFTIGANDEAGVDQWTVSGSPVKRHGLWYVPVSYKGKIRIGPRNAAGGG